MSPRARLGMASACFAVALLAGTAAFLGILARGTGAFISVTSVRGETYDMATNGVYAYNAQRVVAEGVGWDLVTLLLAVPALLIVVPFVYRGSFRGRAFAAGLLGYFLYQYLEYAVTWALGPLFLLFVAIYGTSLIGIGALAWSLVKDHPAEPFAEHFPRRAWAALNLTMSGLLTVMWLGRVAQAATGDSGLLQGETTLTVQALDLGLVVPLSVLGAVLVLRRSVLGNTLMAAYGVTFAAMSAAITGMLISAAVVEETLEVVPIAIFGSALVAALLLLIRTYVTPTTVTHPHGRVRAAGGALG